MQSLLLLEEKTDNITYVDHGNPYLLINLLLLQDFFLSQSASKYQYFVYHSIYCFL